MAVSFLARMLSFALSIETDLRQGTMMLSEEGSGRTVRAVGVPGATSRYVGAVGALAAALLFRYLFVTRSAFRSQTLSTHCL